MDQLATHLPVIVLSKTTQLYIIIMFQVGFDCDVLNAIFEIETIDDSIPEPSENENEI